MAGVYQKLRKPRGRTALGTGDTANASKKTALVIGRIVLFLGLYFWSGTVIGYFIGDDLPESEESSRWMIFFWAWTCSLPLGFLLFFGGEFIMRREIPQRNQIVLMFFAPIVFVTACVMLYALVVAFQKSGLFG